MKVSVPDKTRKKKRRKSVRPHTSERYGKVTPNSPMARKKNGRKNKQKVLLRARNQKRYKKRKSLNLDPSMPMSMKRIVSKVQSERKPVAKVVRKRRLSDFDDSSSDDEGK